MQPTLRRDLRLIAITDSLHDGVDGLTQRARSAVEGGVTMILLRLNGESANTLVEAARALRAGLPAVPLVVTSRIDVALAAGAAGAYLAVDDISPAACRRIVPAGFLIGASVGNDDDVLRAAAADFVGIGPVFGATNATEDGAALGPERFGELARRCKVPAVAIGGVRADNIRAVMDAGASGVASISAVFGSAKPSFSARVLRDSQDASEM